MALEVDRLAIGCGGLTPAILQREREVVLDELRQRQGASGAAIQQMINNDLYPESLVARVAKLKLAEFAGFVGGELPIENQVFGAFGNKAAVDQAIEAAQKIER